MSHAPSSLDSDSELVQRAQAGDSGAFEELILKYGEKLYGMIYNMTSNKEDTHDLLQEVFARAYRGLSSFEGRSTFYTWLYQISVNQTLNFLKQRKRRSGLSLHRMAPSVEQEPVLADPCWDADPERSATVHELQIRLNQALQELSEAHRSVVVLFDIQGLRHREIAEVLNVSVGTVRSRLHYAHRQLQTHLEDFRG